MNWLVSLRTFLGHDESSILTPDTTGVSQDTLEALENAERALKEAEARRDEIKKVTESLTRLRNRNHFGESIQLAMRSKGRRR